MQLPTLAEKQQIVQLRLLIARAAQEDSLKWWEDNSLTPSGKFLLDKIFVYAPDEAGRKLALKTARNRFQAAFEQEPNSLHLFRLEAGGAVEYALREVDPHQVEMSEYPIPTLEDLKQQLARIVGSPPGYEVVSERGDRRLEIRLRDNHVRTDPLRLAQVFAWASLEGKPGAPLFPYLSSHS